MSRENVRLVRRGLFPEGLDLVQLVRDERFQEAVNPELFAPDVVVAFITPSGPPTEFHGFQGLLEGWRDWLIPWKSYEVEVEELVDAGERVLAYAVLRGETRHDGVQLEQPAAAVVIIAGGKITRVEFHLDRREALAAAGLSD
ncbi:MAG TPA: nuclear transport factor 2 family protein [Thermoleophilaceae bacterium]